MDIAEKLEHSALLALSKCMAVKASEDVLLIYDRSTTSIADAFKSAAAIMKLKLVMRKIEITGGNGQDPDPETCELMKKYPVALAPTKYSLTHCSATRKAREAGARIATLPGITSDVFARGLGADPEILRKSGEKWIKKISGSHSVKVTSPVGTDLIFRIGNCPVQNDDGCITKSGDCGNLPAGEVFTVPAPATGNGILVIDGSIGSFDWKESDKPAIIHVKDGRAVFFEGERAKALENLLGKYGDKGFVLAEFGIGTNPEAEINGNLLEDEKVKGTVHFAFGNNRNFGGDNDVPVHIDGILRSPDIILDNKETLMRNGEWMF
ncbi:MAG: hypothetical protein A2020_13945 [Lentisphaerae bacterium GWF2_45_14]|nr:MAG: hypothetical protein A2020_13945 [Lentisphaerae bacterium GWF2_45_14]